MDKMKVALAQMQIVWEDKPNSFTKVISFTEQAKEKNADMILFPEMSLTGFSMNTKITAEDDSLETVEKIRTLCRQKNIAMGIGWTKQGTEKAENHYTIIDKEGMVLSDYVKIHPFSYGGEAEFFQGGNTISCFSLGGYTWSTLICYDLRFPEVFQIAAQKADIIVVPANWPQSREDHWRTLLKARSIETQCYILGVNCVGMVGDLAYSGCSSVYSPEGKCICELTDEEGLVITTIERQALTIRESFPVRQDRKWEFYRQEYKKR